MTKYIILKMPEDATRTYEIDTMIVLNRLNFDYQWYNGGGHTDDVLFE